MTIHEIPCRVNEDTKRHYENMDAEMDATICDFGAYDFVDDEMIEEAIGDAIIGNAEKQSLIVDAAIGKSLYEFMAEGIPLDISTANYNDKLTGAQKEKLTRAAVALYADVIASMRNMAVVNFK